MQLRVRVVLRVRVAACTANRCASSSFPRADPDGLYRLRRRHIDLPCTPTPEGGKEQGLRGGVVECNVVGGVVESV